MIDVHGHVFNAAYVPIPGVLRTRVGMSVELAHTAGRIFNHLVQLDPFGPSAAAADPLDFSLAERELEADMPIESDNEVAVRWIVERTPDEVLAGITRDVELANAMLGPAPELALMRLEMLEYSGARMDLARFLSNLIRNARGWGRWLILLLSRESVIVGKMYKLYPDVDHFVVHMMDMDNFYEGDSKLEFVDEQIPRLAALASASGGRLLPFVAFDPTRDRAVDIVCGAIKEHGFKGVKFYPPSGYRPLNNTAADVPPGVDPMLVEKNIRDLYDFCVDTGTPIFTHCQPKGMDARPDTGALSHPRGWQDVLEKYGRLRLCIGHAGGEPAWFQEDLTNDEAEWRLKTIELCCRYENVYCEVGHLDDLLDTTVRKRFRDRLGEAVQAPGEFRFAAKLMYGSDYHLLVRTKNFQRIPGFLREVVDSAGIDPDSFFKANARRYLDL
ncbi:MAG TPA: amidohydrolase family protein [Longimicrobium sp.]|nr:amidohydrolase family protein [Longimicrobium sp.]